LTVYEEPTSKVIHLLVSSYEKESGPYRFGHVYLLGPKGELVNALEGSASKERVPGGIGYHWMWAQTAISSAVTAGFDKEVRYWKKKISQLETEPGREQGADWEQKCENATCRWRNGREKKWAQ
jgi:hypothetical protein